MIESLNKNIDWAASDRAREVQQQWQVYLKTLQAEQEVHIGPKGGKYRIVGGRKRYDVA